MDLLFDTFYEVDFKDLELMFPVSQLISIGRFDEKLNKHFIQTGKTVFKPMNEPGLEEKEGNN